MWFIRSLRFQTSSAPTADSSRQRIVIPERHKLQLNNTLKNAAQATKNAAENLAKQQPAAKNATALTKNANSTANSAAVCSSFYEFTYYYV